MVTRVPIYLGGTGESTQAAAQAALGLHTSNSVAFTTVTIGAVNVLANDGVTLATARGNDHSTLLTAYSNDGATLATARGNDHVTFIAVTTNPTITGNVLINSNSANDALRINQIGSGNAFVVEDSANPDATPFVITGAGNIGIGTSSPDYLLTLQTGDAAISMKDTGGTTRAYIGIAGIDGGSPTGALRLRSDQGGIVFSYSGSETMRIDSAGRVGIGTSSPSYKLDVSGTMRVGGNTFDFGGSDATNTIMNVGAGATGNKFAVTDYIGDTTYSDFGLRVGRRNDGANGTSTIEHRGTGSLAISAFDAGYITLGTSNIERMRIDSSGNVGIGTNSPTATLDVVGTFSDAKANIVAQTLTDAATINWDTSLGRIATVILGGNRLLAAPSNVKVGTYILNVIQDATGNRALTFNVAFKFTAAVAPTLTTTANARDIFSFISDGTNLYGAMIPDVR